MQKLLTEATVAKLKHDPDKRLEIHDTVVPGLRLRVTPKGKKSWSLMFKVAGVTADGGRGPNIRLTIGEYPLISLKNARELANDAKELADQGNNPKDERRVSITAKRDRQFSKAVDSFIELHAKPHQELA